MIAVRSGKLPKVVTSNFRKLVASIQGKMEKNAHVSVSMYRPRPTCPICPPALNVFPSFQAMKLFVWDALAAEKCTSIVGRSVLTKFVIITDCIQRVLNQTMFVMADL